MCSIKAGVFVCNFIARGIESLNSIKGLKSGKSRDSFSSHSGSDSGIRFLNNFVASLESIFLHFAIFVIHTPKCLGDGRCLCTFGSL